MGMPANIDARRYYRVAYQRLEDGDLLFERLERSNAAIYLSGYAVECILKSLLLTHTPARRRAVLLASFRGAIAHNIDWLRQQLVSRGIRTPAAEARHLSYVTSWSTDLRYEPGPGDPQDAKAFLRAARAILAWANGRM
jgi:HEPN domain-containing protein